MKRFNNSEDFGSLADKGWNDLSSKLDAHIPVKTPVRSSFYQKIIAASLLLLIGLLVFGYSLRKKETRTVQPLPQIVNHFSFNVEAPKIALLPLVKNSSSNLKSPDTKNKIDFSAAHLDMKEPNKSQNDLFAQEFLARELVLSTRLLPTKLTQVDHTLDRTIEGAAKVVDLPLQLDSKNARLGINLNSSARGFLEGTGIGGGVSVVFSIGKWFSVEPGVGYNVMKMGTPTQKVESVKYPTVAAFAATPDMEIKYRLRQSIAMPLSFHFQPIKQFALTGGVDVGLLISQRMAFETDNRAYDPFKSYKKQLSDSELNQMNRFNLAAHGGVSWFPTQSWKLGLFYGQNLTNETKAKQSKPKYSNHSFKVRMAYYF